ncbi:MAG: Phosphoribosylformylglycinamidine synthase subunit PurL [Candidatus Thorarchaeota archaeon]|nr:MAG: Phosphoribosylformylglycinamidine synthase subunit PurL [Candidatus Thorarchaeota archaeon]
MLTKQELEHATKVLGREPTETELNMLDVLWSEHCSYKSSQRWFHLFKTEGERVFLGPGEGAGLVDIGDDVLVGVAMESHNHPSQIDPYNGAATGVGGIIRDVISQGCRPVGLMNCLRFGPLSKPHNAYLLENSVHGISQYGNSVGIPMIGGEVQFDSSYDDNCLINVVCIGTLTPDKIVRSTAKTPGHLLIMFGSTTGRDGIAGVSFASESFSDEEDENRGAVQIGDPLAKKVVLDVLEELIEKELLAGLQDLGGGGLTSAAGEMASKGGTGVLIEVDNVPLREKGMIAQEIIISESQERMLAIVDPANKEAVFEILEKHDTPYGAIGKVTDDAFYTVMENGEIRARLPINLLVEGFPVPERIEEQLQMGSGSHAWLQEPEDHAEFLLRMLESLNICDRSWVYSQYDQHVQANTIVDIGENSGVIEFPKGKMLAFSSDCNSYWCLLDPRSGAANSAAESLRNLVAMGARPIFIADCLNFGNPERPESYSQFVEAVRGLGQFSHDFDIPVVGGNVSLYNEAVVEGEHKRINPTPQIMIGGIFEQGIAPVRRNLTTPLANIFLVGTTHRELNGSEFQRLTIDKVKGIPPIYQPQVEAKVMGAMLEAHKRRIMRSCNNIGRGGLAIALMKMIMNSEVGFTINADEIPGTSKTLTENLYSETSARYLAEVTESNQPEFHELMEENNIPITELGLVVTDKVANFGSFSISIGKAREVYRKGIAKFME